MSSLLIVVTVLMIVLTGTTVQSFRTKIAQYRRYSRSYEIHQSLNLNLPALKEFAEAIKKDPSILFLPELDFLLTALSLYGELEWSGPAPESVGSKEYWENAQVSEGLTHIKYNKFAPTPEEAAQMSDAEFRGTIYKRMKEAEMERRKAGNIGSASSDDYINNLSRKRSVE